MSESRTVQTNIEITVPVEHVRLTSDLESSSNPRRCAATQQPIFVDDVCLESKACTVQTNIMTEYGSVSSRNHCRSDPVQIQSQIVYASFTFSILLMIVQRCGLAFGRPALRCTECTLTDWMCFGSVPHHKKSTWSWSIAKISRRALLTPFILRN